MAEGIYRQNQLSEQGIALVNPTDKYILIETDEAAADKYYGFITRQGDNWYIMKAIQNSVDVISFKYFTEKENINQNVEVFKIAWAARASNTYYYPNQINLR